MSCVFIHLKKKVMPACWVKLSYKHGATHMAVIRFSPGINNDEFDNR